MAWCRQAPSHYLCWCWPRSVSPFVITWPHYVRIQPKSLWPPLWPWTMLRSVLPNSYLSLDYSRLKAQSLHYSMHVSNCELWCPVVKWYHDIYIMSIWRQLHFCWHHDNWSWQNNSAWLREMGQTTHFYRQTYSVPHWGMLWWGSLYIFLYQFSLFFEIEEKLCICYISRSYLADAPTA